MKLWKTIAFSVALLGTTGSVWSMYGTGAASRSSDPQQEETRNRLVIVVHGKEAEDMKLSALEAPVPFPQLQQVCLLRIRREASAKGQPALEMLDDLQSLQASVLLYDKMKEIHRVLVGASEIKNEAILPSFLSYGREIELIINPQGTNSDNTEGSRINFLKEMLSGDTLIEGLREKFKAELRLAEEKLAKKEAEKKDLVSSSNNFYQNTLPLIRGALEQGLFAQAVDHLKEGATSHGLPIHVALEIAHSDLEAYLLQFVRKCERTQVGYRLSDPLPSFSVSSAWRMTPLDAQQDSVFKLYLNCPAENLREFIGQSYFVLPYGHSILSSRVLVEVGSSPDGSTIASFSGPTTPFIYGPYSLGMFEKMGDETTPLLRSFSTPCAHSIVDWTSGGWVKGHTVSPQSTPERPISVCFVPNNPKNFISYAAGNFLGSISGDKRRILALEEKGPWLHIHYEGNPFPVEDQQTQVGSHAVSLVEDPHGNNVLLGKTTVRLNPTVNPTLPEPGQLIYGMMAQTLPKIVVSVTTDGTLQLSGRDPIAPCFKDNSCLVYFSPFTGVSRRAVDWSDGWMRGWEIPAPGTTLSGKFFIPLSEENQKEYHPGRAIYLADGTKGVIKELGVEGPWIHVRLENPIDISILNKRSTSGHTNISFDPSGAPPEELEGTVSVDATGKIAFSS